MQRESWWQPDQLDGLALEAKFNVQKFAGLCGVSRRQIERLCERNFARQPRELLTERRMAIARERLLSGQRVKDIAVGLGYRQISHFSRQFKEWFGVAPSTLRSVQHDVALR